MSLEECWEEFKKSALDKDLEDILYNDTITVRGKMRRFNKLGVAIDVEGIKNLLKERGIPAPKSPYFRQRSIESAPSVRPKVAGEGVHALKKPHRRAAAEQGFILPKGREIHHLDANHANNSIDNLAAITTEGHDAIHSVYDTPEKMKHFLGSAVGEDPKLREIMFDMKPLKQRKRTNTTDVMIKVNSVLYLL